MWVINILFISNEYYYSELILNLRFAPLHPTVGRPDWWAADEPSAPSGAMSGHRDSYHVRSVCRRWGLIHRMTTALSPCPPAIISNERHQRIIYTSNAIRHNERDRGIILYTLESLLYDDGIIIHGSVVYFRWFDD